LAQKARDALRQIGYPQRPRDEAYGFNWDEDLTQHVARTDKPAPAWDRVFTQRPSPMTFWYRQSEQPLTALMFHSDLLTPGLVDLGDPPPILSGMRSVMLDHQGRLLAFDAIPPQRRDAPVQPAPVDWSGLFALSGLDQSKFQPADPLWFWVPSSDTRVAWTGTWPDSGRPLRIEAAALGGQPVVFMLTGEWSKPWRMAEPSESGETLTVLALAALAILAMTGAGLLAYRNLKERRGDRRGAVRLAAMMTGGLLALWTCQVHLVASIGLIATLLLAVATSVFYGFLLWTLYVALEPSVRRHWPQVLVSWTSALTGNVRDPIVGRDVLIGTALGVVWVLLIRSVARWANDAGDFADFPGSMAVLAGLRATVGRVLQDAPYALRNVLVFFFLLFMLRILLRSGWAANIAFASAFALLSAIGNAEAPIRNAVVGFLYFGSGAFVVLRWGLVSYVTGTFVTTLILNAPVTTDTSAWYFGNAALLLGIPVALAAWGAATASRRRV
jgi:serine/threonine-protein kinase